ncbi:nucleotidyltransferase domain-containing protein [Pedobacter sp. ISL-68]|uniref:DNA polymerase beta superfamily protein n=1 Tax=unclassified Pedobacter TaxID=2628915 RepID=UPI001BEC83CE|nr:MULTISPECIES: nucleotidyltransferase domain-containing protein [unclassified Pedobacter]MBT2562242.1 nucleotidyltransferase domain-containing protein [Pedobacter sp. ISL-64]MBT2588987.1 nucleotidyltransferase domain-containing protein [Pedobacter sp. ISL-68]
MTIKDLKDKNLLLFECLSGSKAYGLATPQSDTDIKGIYYMPKEMFFGLKYISQISDESNDEVYYEIGRFIELLIKNNPNIVEILATPEDCILYKHPIMDKLRIEMVLSKLCKDTFGGYALTQIRKAKGLNKKILNPMPKTRKTVLDFCFITVNYSSVKAKTWLTKNGISKADCGLSKIPNAKDLYALFHDAEKKLNYKGIANKEAANEVSVSSIPAGEQEIAYLFFNKDSYSSYCKEYNEYWEWVEKRNEDRYSLNKSHGKDYDAKNMMHTIRLLQVALEIVRDGELNVKRQNRDELLLIKRGELDYDEVLKMAEKLMLLIEQETTKSKLQDKPDAKLIEMLLVEMRTELYAN